MRQNNARLAGQVSVWKLLQSCHALRNEMAHLCGQLQAYLMFEVLERAWVELTENLASVSHLDDLIGRPDIYCHLPQCLPLHTCAEGICDTSAAH